VSLFRRQQQQHILFLKNLLNKGGLNRLYKYEVMTTKPTIFFSDNSRIELEIKGTKFVIPFENSFRFLKPSASRAVDSAAEGDTRVHKHTWWIVCDLGLPPVSELRCSWEGAERGFQVQYSTPRTRISFRVPESEMKPLYQAVHHMIMLSVIENGSQMKKEAVQILRPAGSELEYRVSPITYEREKVKQAQNITNVPRLQAPPKKNKLLRPFH